MQINTSRGYFLLFCIEVALISGTLYVNSTIFRCYYFILKKKTLEDALLALKILSAFRIVIMLQLTGCRSGLTECSCKDADT